MKKNKLISILILFLIIYLCFSSISFAANIDKLPQDFGSFDKYLEAIVNESATVLDEKADQSFPYGGWEGAKTSTIERFEVEDDADNTDDRK